MRKKFIPPFSIEIIFSAIFLLLLTCSKDNGVESHSGDRPSPPGNVAAVPGQEQVTITWDQAEGAESYNLYWSNRQNVTYDARKIENVVSPYKHTGLDFDSTYYYRITSVNDFGESAMSDELKAIPLPRVEKPGVPGNIQVAAGDKKIMISWDTVSGVARYNIYWSDSSGVNTNSMKIADVTTPFIHGNLSNGTMYYYRVSAENEAGESGLSATKYAVPNPATTVPNPPNNIRIYERNSLLTFTWDPVINADLFNVYWSYSSTVSKADNKEIATTTPFDLINLENNKKIYIRISSLNDIGEGQLSVTYSAVPMPLLPPGNFEASVSYRQVTLSWGKVSNATSYNLYWTWSGAVDTIPVKIANVTAPFVHDLLDPSATYLYRIASATPFEESRLSAAEIAEPELIPPDEIAAKGGYRENRLTWSSVPHVPAYLVSWRTGSGADTASGTAVCSTSSFTHEGLSLNTSYYYQVFSKDGESVSTSYAGTSATTILDRPVAKAGSDVQVTRGDTVRLHGISTDSIGTIVKYEWKIGDNDWAATSSGDTTVIAPDSTRTIVCKFRVTDDDSLESSDEMKIVIALDPPKAALKASRTTAGFNDTVAFIIEASDSGRIVSYELKLGAEDWITVSGKDTTVFTPSVAGTWVCSLKVTDDDGEYAFGRVAIAVKSKPPTVTAQGTPLTTGLNDPVTLSSEATDDGSIVSYQWKFGSGDWITTSTRDTIVRTPFTAGTWICSLLVTDDDGEMARKVVSVKVESRPPKVTVQGTPLTTGFNDSVVLTANATDNGTVTRYEWKFDANDWITVTDGDTTVKTPFASGQWICIVRATDDDGETALDTVLISVTSHPPAVTASSNVNSTGFSEPVAFSGTVNDNEAGLRYFWKFGNNDWVESPTIAMTANTPAEAGAWVCSLRVIDADGETGSAQVTITVVSSPPTVTAAAAPISTGLNEPVTLSVTASDNGSIARYEWKLGSSAWLTASGSDTVVYTPLTSGTWTCSVQVTDDDGEQTTAQVSIAVVSNPPVVQATANPVSTGPNEPVTFTASATDNGSVERYEWQFGAGTWIEVSDGDTVAHTPFTTGTWTCSVRVTDDDGEQSTREVTVTVVSSPPVVQVTVTPDTIGLNDTVTLDASATDDGSVERYEWKFGSGSWIEVSGGDTTVISPNILGTWTCSLRVTDDDREAATRETAIRIHSMPPTATASTNRNGVRVNEQVTLSAAGTDNGSVVSFEWKFGAGAWIHASGNDTTVTVPSTVQTWVCSLQVIDDDGESGFDELRIYVDPETVTDIDGNTYTTVRIGDQLWTVQNLRTTTYNDGVGIPHLTDSSDWDNTTDGAYCFYNNSTDASFQQKFGALYNFYAIQTGRLAPAGWHVPSHSEWKELENFVAASGVSYPVKAIVAQTDWLYSDVEGSVGNDPSSNNSTGLTILPGGHRDHFGIFSSPEFAMLATSTRYSSITCYIRWLNHFSSYISMPDNWGNHGSGCSVRLVKD